MTKKNLYETGLVVGDTHCPFHDPKALKGVLEFTKDLQPDYVFFLGDIIDFFDVSRFSRSPLRTLSVREINEIKKKKTDTDKTDLVLQAAMQRELDDTWELLSSFRKAAPLAKMIYIFGNHEYRLYRFLMEQAPQLYGLSRAGQQGKDILGIPYLLRLDELEIEPVFSGKAESYYKWGDYLVLGHFNMVRKHSAFTAKGLVDDKNVSLIQGHTHRMGTFYKTVFGNNQMVGHENGCLCSMSPEYMSDPNWQQGFSVVHKKKGGSRFHIQPVPIVDHKFFYGDKEYSGGDELDKKKFYRPKD